ncbi:MAG: hypothetical protein JWQ71_3319 [Pedosphaera sp.]|nr:hypothetical protein [Pedosphaera sp.]
MIRNVCLNRHLVQNNSLKNLPPISNCRERGLPKRTE